MVLDNNNSVTITRRPFLSTGISLICLLAAALLGSACKSGYPVAAKNPPGSSSETRQVKVAAVTDVPMERVVTVTGTLAAYDQATVSAKVPGRVQAIIVDLGSVVKQGQTIAQLDPQDYKLRLQQAEAALAQARARVGLSPDGKDDRIDPEETGTVRQARALLDDARQKRERAASLLGQGVIAQAQLDSADADLKVALSRYQDAIEEIRNRQAMVGQRRTELEIARQQLADCLIYAPFSGVVQEKRASVGEYLAPGAPVVNVVRVDPLRLRAEVPEREARNVVSGQQVRLTVEGDPNLYTGRIVRLSPTITAQSRLLIVEAEVRNTGNLRPGSFARADIVADVETTVAAVPTNSIISFAGIDKVITIQDGKALEKPITTGRQSGEWTEVLSGVKVGENVIVNPGNLQSGQPVTVQD